MRLREIQRLTKVLLARKDQIERNLNGVVEEAVSAAQSEINDEADVAAISVGAQTDAAIGEQQLKELKEIEHALSKVSSGNFGVCEMCGEKIGLDRMRVKPHARYCIVCREAYEKNYSEERVNHSGFVRV
ncbi:MAG: RNA polymerase-binding protein DksA [Helicobacteraceae bacterium]|jgi:DnaK suppressor protein|nr:RNA polymerase-binding protein DksA [Helicobacteraceae bacterium]